MKKMIILVLTALIASNIYAQVEKEKFSHLSLGIRGGISIMRDYGVSQAVSDRLNYLGGANLEYTFNPLWGFGVDYVYLPYDQDYSKNGGVGKLTALAHEVTAYASFNISNLVAPYRSAQWFNFYTNAGAGVSLFDYDNTMSAQNGNDKCLVIPIGAMMEFNMGKAFAMNLGAEYRWHNYSDMKKDLINENLGGNGFLTGNVGFKFKFSGSKPHVRNISYQTFQKARAFDEYASRIAALQNEANTLKSTVGTQESKLGTQASQIDALSKSVQGLEGKLSGFMANTSSKELRNAEEIAAIKRAQETVVKDAFNTLEFEVGSAIIKASSYKSLEKLAEILQTNPSWKLTLDGYTDNTGSLDKNIQLSRERANAVKNFLVEKGISGSRITVDGHGPANPIAPNNTKEGKAKNRRVEIQID